MRIGLLSRGFPPECPDGIPRIREILAAGFAARGHEVHVITQGKGPAFERRDDYNIHRIPPLETTRFFAPSQPVANAMLTYSQAVFEIIAASIEPAYGPLDLLDSPLWEIEGFTAAMERPQLPVIVRIETTSRHVHEINGFDFNDQRRFEFDLEKAFIARAEGLLFDSESAREEFRRLYGKELSNARECVILHGSPLPDLPPSGKKAEVAGRVLSVGRLEKRKGTHHLFGVVRQVLEAIPEASFHIIGRDNSRHDGFAAATGRDYVSWFREQHADLADRVTFTGLVDAQTLAQEYASASVAVVPSIYESFGLTYVEAMGYAKPVVAFDVGGAKEILAGGEAGTLVPLGDEPAMAGAIVSLLQDNGARDRMGEAARLRAELAFAPGRMVDETLRFYEMVKRGTGLKPVQ